MNVDCGGIGLDDEPATELEDARLGVPLEQLPGRGLTRYSRAEASTVWHWQPGCPAFPVDGAVWSHLGEPLLGMKCRECGRRERSP